MGVGVGVGVGVGASPTPNHASSNTATAPLEDPGWNINRNTADRAPSGARAGPTDSAVHDRFPDPSPVTVRSCRPLPSPDAYQAIRRNTSPRPVTTCPHADASYQAPPSTVTAWYSHFVDVVVDLRMAARSPVNGSATTPRPPPWPRHPTGLPSRRSSNPPL